MLTKKEIDRLFIVLVIIEILFVAVYCLDAYLGQPFWNIHTLFDLDKEANVPAWFSSVQFFCIGIVFLLSRRLLPKEISYARRLLAVIGCIFVYLSADETASIHEKINAVFKKYSFIWRFEGNNGIWIFVYVFFGAVFLMYFGRAFVSLYRAYRHEFILVAVGLGVLVAAVGFEIAGYQLMIEAKKNIIFYLEVSAEEFLEMLGESIIFYGSLLFYRKISVG